MGSYYLVHFSPGGTGKKTIEAVAKGFPSHISWTQIDLCEPEQREALHRFNKEDFMILVVPTMSNIFGVEGMLNRLIGQDTSMVAMVMYGNQFSGVALPRLVEQMKKQGFRTIGAGNFIGQHSCDPTCAKGRPDKFDLEKAKELGVATWKKISKGNRINALPEIPADRPMVISPTTLWSNIKISAISSKRKNVNPLVNHWCQFQVNDQCIGCGLCSTKCPVQAISMVNGKAVHDLSSCIGCYRCVNQCPTHAIENKSKQLAFFQRELKAYSSRREPVVYI